MIIYEHQSRMDLFGPEVVVEIVDHLFYQFQDLDSELSRHNHFKILHQVIFQQSGHPLSTLLRINGFFPTRVES
jgi:hypothetical protein